ncbi:VWA domain-containing protein [Mediterraneibacter glycyrrhizinilyticus]|uniref:vWA domain-containing protein n=1 Tax=Mediterraneibacter glycyrrhizinilyticus TaxID=342942 RepID=UPI0025AB4D66|nr:VWA domain-containing protein [Mediterraneibacter glycyrrhizinilyticus]MDN0061403.1 VWA domain-containing protein [Mediterraneibacter glycyrrhizinilyticus]
MKRAKRILALVLAVVMIAGMAPIQALDVHAAGTDQSTEMTTVTDENTSETNSSVDESNTVDENESEPVDQDDDASADTDESDEALQSEQNNASAETQAGAGDTADAQQETAVQTTDDATVQAEPREVTTAVYEQVDRITDGEEYLIVYRTGYYGEYYALTVNGNDLDAMQVNPSNGEIQLTAEEDNILWTINSNSIQINGQTLKGYYSHGSYYAGLGSGNSGTNFTVNNNNSIRARIYGDNRYLSYSNNSWSVSRTSNNSFTFYQKAETADEPLYPDDPTGVENPQYPNQGSVRNTKAATADDFRANGVAQVELGVTGVPMKRGVDIVLVLDVSTSMEDNNKMEDAKEAAKNFIENYVFVDNADGSKSNNRLGLVTFSGYGRNSYDGTGNDIQYLLKNANAKDEILSTIDNLDMHAGTDYDFAFSGADEVLDGALDAREKYVVFMTDGAPSKYNDYNHGDNGRYFDYKEHVLDNTLNAAEALKSNHTGTEVYTIGFDMANGSDVTDNGSISFDASECRSILQKIASDSNHYINADNSEALNAAFEKIGSNIRKAGTEAVVTDIVGSAYTLQKAVYHAKYNDEKSEQIQPVIEVKNYRLDESGNRVGEPEILERVTFSEDGTTATSSVSGQLEVSDNGSFNANYFTYTVTGSGDNKTETFTWNIGDINDTEIVLSYYVYLKGSMEGTRGDGIYPTNESAVLDYTNYLGHDAQKTFGRPVLPWGAATVTYEFYLVNEQGQPVNSEGTVIPETERVKVVSPQTERFNWNSQTAIEASLEAQKYVPDGYTLHMPDAVFTAHAVSSGNGSVSATGTIPSGSQNSTLYGTYDPQCTSTWVAFGVLNKTNLIPDSVVLDYGKKVKIDVMTNDLLQNAELDSVAQEDALENDFDLENGSTTELADGFGASVNLTNGTAEVKEGKVEYTPTKYMDSIDHFLYSAKITMETEDGDTETQYKYQKVSVIPATTVYYEDNFGNTEDEDGSNGIIFSGAWDEVQEGTAGSDYQDNGTVAGDGHPYGNDSSYVDNDKLSGGSAMVVTAEGDKNATASFTFKGTGFDLISRTDSNSAMIAIAVQDAEGNYVQRKMLDLEYSSGTLYQIPVHMARFEEYGEYTVTITVSNAGGTANFYLDAIRIYNPIDPNGADAEEANDRYQADNEANAEITELRNILLDAEDYKGGVADGILYTDGKEDGTAVYQDEGPNNEVYLKPGHSVGFKLHVSAGMETVQLGAKAVNGDVTVTAGSNQTSQRSMTLTTASDMYYDITNTLYLTSNGDGSQDGTVVITNTGSGDAILSLTNIKVTYAEGGSSTFTIDDESVAQIRALAAARAEAGNTEDNTGDNNGDNHGGDSGDNGGDNNGGDNQDPQQPSKPDWQEKWDNVITGIKDTVNSIKDKIHGWFDSWF